MTNEILTKKRCGILLVAACFIYFVLNIVIWAMDLVVAIVGAICATVAFGLFLYFFIRYIGKRKIKERALILAKAGSKNRVCLPPKLVDHLGLSPTATVVQILKTDRNGKNYALMHPVKEENFEAKKHIKKKEDD